MKKIIVLALLGVMLWLTPVAAQAQIVYSGADRDTLALPFRALDSSGNVVSLVSTDSVFIVVFSPGGTAVYNSRMQVNDARIKSYTFTGSDVGTLYALSDRVATLVGSSTSIGEFSYTIVAYDIDLGLHSCKDGFFQRISSAVYDTYMARLDAAISTRSNLTTSDNIGINWGDISNPTTSQALSGTSIFATGSVVNAVDVGSFQNNAITTAAFADGALTAAKFAAASLNGKGDWRLSSNYPTNFVSLAVTGGGAVTVGTNSDKTGYTVSTVQDKTGYALSAAGIDGFWDEDTTGHGIANSFAKMLKDTSAYQGAASGLTAAAIWNIPFVTAFTAGSMGDSLNNASYVQGSASGLTVAQIADGVWDELKTGHTVDDSYGEILPDSLSARTSLALQPTVAGRKLDVTATGGAGIDWANVEAPTTNIALSGTTVGAVSGAVGSVTGNVGGSVGSVTGAVGSVTSNVTLADGYLTAVKFGAGSLNGKGDWKLSSTYPTNFNSFALDGSGRVTVLSNADKTGYSISGTRTTLDALAPDFAGVNANLDTLAMWLGIHTTSKSITHYQTDHDTVFVYNGSDLLGRMVFYHIGDTPGAPPDSTKVAP